MGRHKQGFKQEFFSFAITPKSERDQAVVLALRTMRDNNEFTAWIKALIYNALAEPSKPIPTASNGVKAILPQQPIQPTRPPFTPVPKLGK